MAGCQIRTWVIVPSVLAEKSPPQMPVTAGSLSGGVPDPESGKYASKVAAPAAGMVMMRLFCRSGRDAGRVTGQRVRVLIGA